MPQTAPKAAITGSAVFTPAESISNEELVVSYNAWASAENEARAPAIASGTATALPLSSPEFIVKASGIRARYVVEKAGILDPARMRPVIATRRDDEPSLLAEMALDAAQRALAGAGRTGADVDAIIMAASNPPRPYPALAVEIQHYLGARGWAYDMNVACASAAFGVQAAADAITNGSASCVLVLCPEVTSGHLNWRNRDCHFIFGDAATALVIERVDAVGAGATHPRFEILGTRLKTLYSNNIRNNFGYLNEMETPPRAWDDTVFRQEGRKVFRDVVPLVAEMLESQLTALGLTVPDVRRLWLHQANLSMNQLIAKRLLGREASETEAPVILDRYANTSSAGSVIAFHFHHADLKPGDIGILSGFGAGYSAGSAVLRRA